MFFKNSNKLNVVFLTIFSTFSAAIMATGVKYLSEFLNPIMIGFYRCFIGLIIIIPFILRNKFEAVKTKNLKLHFLRSLINVISLIAWFSAIGLLFLEKATALGFTTPLFTTILAVLLLGEIIRIHRIAALLLGFIGVIIIVRPGIISFDYGTILILVGAITFSFVLIIVKKLSATESSITITFYHLFFCTSILFIISLFFWQNINLNHLFIFIIMAISGLIAHWCLAQSLKLSDATFVMPLQFSKLIWASSIGFYFFNEVPDLWTWIGSVIIFSSVIYITYRESFVKQNNLKVKQIDRAIIE